MNKISVAIATFNEEKNIKDCLESVKDFADEIVIVDGTSTDKTVEIAKNYTDKIIITQNRPMFHINKNMAIRAAKGNWILLLDADERVSQELAEEMREIADKGSKFNGFWIKRKNYFLGRWLKKGGAYPDPVIRFFKKGKGHLPCRSVHEQMTIDGETGWLKNDLIHIADPNFSRYLLRSNRYTSLEAEKIAKVDPGLGVVTMFEYFCLRPCLRFLSLYFRHKGFMDGFAGFVWSFYSALHIFTAYVKYWEAKSAKKDLDIKSDWY